MGVVRVGVLALQGAYELHRWHLEAAGAEYVPVVRPEDLQAVGGLILPGGESTVMMKLIHQLGLREPLVEFARARPVWGICAGAILLSRERLGVMAIDVVRNAYGRQLDSFQMEMLGHPVAYIRAPVLSVVGDGVEVLAEHLGMASWVRSGHCQAMAFHPEIARGMVSPWHLGFVEAVARAIEPLPTGA